MTVESILTLDQPPACPLCRAEEPIVLETRILGRRIAVAWRCETCDHFWPVPIQNSRPLPTRRVH
jgi:hypothetical protein